ncbi:MAG: hypothetical protein H6581_03035 [Bacteroidia bacterium]|nr:hypothetical protein [Bacteroidia bacterium]
MPPDNLHAITASNQKFYQHVGRMLIYPALEPGESRFLQMPLEVEISMKSQVHLTVFV